MSKRIYILYGEDLFALEEFEKKLIEENVDPSWEAFNLDILDGNDIGLDKVIESADSPPLGFGNKVTIVKKAEIVLSKDSDNLELLESLLVRNLMETNILVFSFQSLDKRKSIIKNLISQAEVKEFNLPKPWEIEKKISPWIEDYLRKFGKRIEKDAIHEIVESTNGNKHRIERELEKLLLYINERNIIKYEDVRALVVNDQSDIFEFLEFLARREIDNALVQLNKIILKDNPIKIVATISSSVKNLYNQKLLNEEGLSNNDVAKKLGQSPFMVEKNIKLWRNFNSGKFREILRNILDLELKFKSVSVNNKIELEKFFIKNFSK
ncbi:MAG: DNA polymerase III subunit delta [Candidatus Sericytochromatia bacterium]